MVAGGVVIAVTAVEARRAPSARRASIAVVGAGNIGSHVLPLLARIDGLGALTIVDKDVYEKKNLNGQAILPTDVGKAKAIVQAARMRRLAPELVVRTIAAALENLPLGSFRADLIVGCLDSREGRRRLSEIAFRLSVPFIDAGVHADGLLARVTVYDPRNDDAACVECAWGTTDYAALEQVYPCQGAATSAPATNASAALGALAAALQAIECEKWLRERSDRLAPGSEVLIDAASHTHYRSTIRRNPSCRFDHERWTIERLAETPAALSLGDALAMAKGGVGRGDTSAPDASRVASPPDAALTVAGQRFVTQLACVACGTARPIARLATTLRPRDRVCAECGHENVPRGFDLSDRLDLAALPAGASRRSLRAFGLRSSDVFTITHASGTQHFELGAQNYRD
jgi:molybdopterin/thiamine biosynthesis adenylyltransferase